MRPASSFYHAASLIPLALYQRRLFPFSIVEVEDEVYRRVRIACQWLRNSMDGGAVRNSKDLLLIARKGLLLADLGQLEDCIGKVSHQFGQEMKMS
jgi:hypothetical protein